jgi:hypothetical protein
VTYSPIAKSLFQFQRSKRVIPSQSTKPGKYQGGNSADRQTVGVELRGAHTRGSDTCHCTWRNDTGLGLEVVRILTNIMPIML